MLRVRSIRIVIGSLLLLLTFYVGVSLRDELAAQALVENTKKLQLGMSEAEVIAILGKPTRRQISDVPGVYWFYDPSSWPRDEEYMGSAMLYMGRDGRLLRI